MGSEVGREAHSPSPSPGEGEIVVPETKGELGAETELAGKLLANTRFA